MEAFSLGRKTIFFQLFFYNAPTGQTLVLDMVLLCEQLYIFFDYPLVVFAAFCPVGATFGFVSAQTGHTCPRSEIDAAL
jgi:hypothetical protein